MRVVATLLLCTLVVLPMLADWPMLHGNAEHNGYVREPLPPKIKVEWIRHFPNERLGTALEAIIGSGKLFIATHQGNLYALEARSGDAAWAFHGEAPFLQAPAWSNGGLFAADAAGNVYGLTAETGHVTWRMTFSDGGFSASPVVAGDRVILGSRGGTFYCLSTREPKIFWQQRLGVPIRQTAAVSGGRVFVTAEDLRARCFDTGTGRLLWTSTRLSGQTTRDYYPQMVSAGGKDYVIIRTNPVQSMGHHIARDRSMLARNAGIDDSDWQKVDTYIKSTNALGDESLWRKEQEAIVDYQKATAAARTFFVLEAETGKEAFVPPVLWVAGCQAVGAQPALTPDGRLLVFYRTAYGNWNHGVAPLVGLGLLDLQKNLITPLRHTSGMQPPWNTFWGTADESQNFTVAGQTVLIAHQGTLSGFDLGTGKLFPIAGERDTYGGLPSPGWGRNEWHGPGRGSVSVSAGRVYWLTGSRILCLGTNPPPGKVEDKPVIVKELRRPEFSARPNLPDPRARLRMVVEDFLAGNWAPLYVEPGLHGREFFFDDSADVFETLALAFPHLDSEVKTKVKAHLADLWQSHPPFAKESAFSLAQGTRREFFSVPRELLSRVGQDKPPHLFGNTWAIWRYAESCDEWARVIAAFPQVEDAFRDFRKSGWRLDPEKGDLHANRYLSGLLAFTKISRAAKRTELAAEADRLATETADALVEWWKTAQKTLTEFKGSGELDPFIGGGDRISFKIAPHRHKLALFHELTPEVAELVRNRAPEAIERVWNLFEQLYATWPYVGEERQVHYGENFIDPPDLALDAFKAAAWLKQVPSDYLLVRVDIPFCQADLFHLQKWAIGAQPR